MKSEETRKITLCGREISYIFARKKVKNLNLRIRAGGSVFVSAPKSASISLVETFLTQNAEKIIRAIDRAHSKAEKEEKGIESGFARLFGADFPIKVEKGKPSAEFKDGFVLLKAPDAADVEKLKKIYDKWEKEIFIATAEKYIQLACEKFAPYGVSRPSIKYRRMKSRWGSCNAKKRAVTLNINLVRCPLPAIELVVFHEFSHFLHQNHGKSFYAALDSFIPDRKQREKLLKE